MNAPEQSGDGTSLNDNVATVAVLKALRDTVNAECQAAHRHILDRPHTARAEMRLKPIRIILPEGTPGATMTMACGTPLYQLRMIDAEGAHHPEPRPGPAMEEPADDTR